MYLGCCVTRSFRLVQELRELTKLDDVSCLVRQEELELSRTPESLEELKMTRAKNRIDALLNKVRRQPPISPCQKFSVHCGVVD